MNHKAALGHTAALITILIWGTTFISTKILLADFTPVEILFFRFLLGLLILTIIYPRRLKLTEWRQELTFAAAGLCGVCLYYLLENVALTYTMASNVGIIISAAPFFTAVLSHLFVKNEECLHARFFLGFFIAIIGICMISFNGSRLSLNPLGDILALMAALLWAAYSLLTRKIGSYDYPVIPATRKVFLYGIVFMIPALFLFDFHIDIQKFMHPEYLLNLIYLGAGASALCFVTWNYAVRALGAVKTSIYIYLVPVITVLTSAIVLGEPVTMMSAAGTALTMAGLFLSGKQ